MLLLHIAFLAAGPLVGVLAAALAQREGAHEASHTVKPAHLRPACGVGGLGVAAWAWAGAPSSLFVLSCLLGWTLLALAAVDVVSRRLPNPLTAGLAVLGGVMVVLSRPEAWLDHAIGGAIGFGTLLLLEILYKRLRGREGLGRGDAKLLGALGVWTGWIGLPSILLIASMTAIAVLAVSSRMTGRALSTSTSIAFGPWIALAGWVVWLHGPLLVAGS